MSTDFESVLTQPTAQEWATASKALAKGNAEPMANVLRTLDMPIALCDVFAAALRDAARWEKETADAAADDLAAIRRDLDVLRRFSPSTQEDAMKTAASIRELEQKLHDASIRASKADVARCALRGVRVYFAELFGCEDESDVLPPSCSPNGDWYNAIIDAPFGLDPYKQGWRSVSRKITAPKVRRKIRAAAIKGK